MAGGERQMPRDWSTNPQTEGRVNDNQLDGIKSHIHDAFINNF